MINDLDLSLDEKSAPKMYTSLPDGSRVRKDDFRIEACGTVDELNSHIGLLASYVPVDMAEELHTVQRFLFAIGAHLAGVDPVKGFPGPDDIAALQLRIQSMQSVVGKFNGFILPCGSTAAAQSHVCRTVCRRAERCAVRLNSYPDVLYLNKLSSFFFFLSTYLNYFKGIDEIKL